MAKKTTKKKTTKKTAGRKTPVKKKAAAKKAPRKTGVGQVALVVRVSKEAIRYIDSARGDGPRTRFIREVLAKGDPKLAKLARMI